MGKQRSSSKTRSFGEVILARRRELGLTQADVAGLVKTSVLFIRRLEANLRCPSDGTVGKLAKALKMDGIELLFLANPEAQLLFQHRKAEASSTWKHFKHDEHMQRAHDVSKQELEMLAQVTLMGDVRSVRDFVYILDTIRSVRSQPETGKVSGRAEVQRCLR